MLPRLRTWDRAKFKRNNYSESSEFIHGRFNGIRKRSFLAELYQVFQEPIHKEQAWMSRLPIVDARTMEKVLLQLGFMRVRQKGILVGYE